MKARRFVSMLLCICMMMGMVLPLEATEVDTPEIPVTLNETEIKADEIWDGSIADSFANGTGTEDDPYQIETAAEFGYFISQMENGVEYNDTYFELKNNLYLNDEIFTTDLDTGMVIVREKDLITYYQSYTKGFQGGNTQFDTTATGGWHRFNNETMMYEKITSYQGNINRLNTQKNNQNKFCGVFNGNNHVISGIYAYESGIFGYLYGTVENLKIANSFFTGNSEQGAIARRNYGTIDNCEVDAIVIGGESTGGITGVNIDTVQNTVSYATVFGHDNNIGGIAGYNTQDIISCTNYGTVIGSKENVGGITGYQYVRSEEEKADEVTISDCANFANIYGQKNVGGIIGGAEIWGYYSPAILNVLHSDNYGMISGTSKMGGIIGELDASKWCNSQINVFLSANHGTITALEDYVGGIIGYSTVINNLSGTTSFLKLSQCYNNGSILGSRYIGGLMGYQYLWYYCYADINNCYNNAAVIGSSHVGGMVGYIEAFNTNFNLQNIYITQHPIAEDEKYGGIASYIDVSLQVPYLRNLYYTDTVNMRAYYYLNYKNRATEDASDKIYNTIAYSKEKAQQSSSYIGFDFDTVWEIGETDGYPYPTLRNNPHVSNNIELPYQVPSMIVLSETEDVPTYITWTPCEDAISYKVIIKNSDTVVSESVVSADQYSFSIAQNPGTYTAFVYAIYDNAEIVSNHFTYIVSATEQGNPLPSYTVPYGTPVIDFENDIIDEIWNTAEWIDISQKSYDFAPDSTTSARAKILNDENNVYFLVEIKDDTPCASNDRMDDRFVVCFDEDNCKIGCDPCDSKHNVSIDSYGNIDYSWNDEGTATVNEYSITLRDTNTYTIEFSLKLKTGTPIDLKSVGLDMQYIDYDENGRNGILGWVTDPDSWTIDYFGTLYFSENTAVCEHNNLNPDAWKSCSYRNIDDPNFHERQDVYARSCADCGEALPDVYDEWKTEDHLWNGNTCSQCLYVKVEEVCEHLNKDTGVLKDSDFRNINDPAVHERQDIYSYSCIDCGESLPDEYMDWNPEEHSWDGNSCSLCGYTAIAEPEEIAPTITGLKDSYTITIGESLTLDGIITAAEDGKLGKVTLKHNEYGTSFEARTLNVGYTSTTANLSDLGALTTDVYPLNAVGTYEFRIFASADNYTDTNNLIATFIVTVVDPICEHDFIQTGNAQNGKKDYFDITLTNHSYCELSLVEYKCNQCGTVKYENDLKYTYREPHTTIISLDNYGKYIECKHCGYSYFDNRTYEPKEAFWNPLNNAKEYVSLEIDFDGYPYIEYSNNEYVEESDEITIVGTKDECYFIKYSVTTGTLKGTYKYRFIGKDKLFETEEDAYDFDISMILNDDAYELYKKDRSFMESQMDYEYAFEYAVEDVVWYNPFTWESVRANISHWVQTTISTPSSLIDKANNDKSLLKAAVRKQLINMIKNENNLIETAKSFGDGGNLLKDAVELVVNTQAVSKLNLSSDDKFTLIKSFTSQVNFYKLKGKSPADIIKELENIETIINGRKIKLSEYFNLTPNTVEIIKSDLSAFRKANKNQKQALISTIENQCFISEHKVPTKLKKVLKIAGIAGNVFSGIVGEVDIIVQILSLNDAYDSYESELLKLVEYSDGLYSECVSEIVNDLKESTFKQILEESGVYVIKTALEIGGDKLIEIGLNKAVDFALKTKGNPWVAYTLICNSVMTTLANTDSVNRHELTLPIIIDELNITRDNIRRTYDLFVKNPSNQLYNELHNYLTVYKYQVELGAATVYMMTMDDYNSLIKSIYRLFDTNFPQNAADAQKADLNKLNSVLTSFGY